MSSLLLIKTCWTHSRNSLDKWVYKSVKSCLYLNLVFFILLGLCLEAGVGSDRDCVCVCVCCATLHSLELVSLYDDTQLEHQLRGALQERGQ